MRCSTAVRWFAVWGCCLAMPAAGPADPVPAKQSPAPAWVHWRGPTGQGYSDDTRVPLTWSEDKNILWKTKLPGAGHSSPIIWGDRIFLTAADKGGRERYVLCVRRKDGKILWKKLAATDSRPGQTHPWNGYASASCTTDGQRVYAFFGTPGLFCYDFDGKEVWKRTFGAFTSVWGTAASPFLYEDLVILNCDNDGPAGLAPGERGQKTAPMELVAMDKKTGDIRWRTPRNLGRGFSTPRLLTTAKGGVELILNGPQSVRAYNPRTGKELWRVDRKGEQARFGEPIPVSNKDTLFVASGRPGPMQAIRLGGSGDLTRTNVLWQITRKGRDVSSHLLWKDLLYAVDRAAVLTCYDTRDGKALYSKRLAAGAVALASPVLVRGKVLLTLDNGLTLVIEPGRTLKIVGRNPLGDGSQLDFGASPAIVDGQLFLRSQSHLYCIGEKK